MNNSEPRFNTAFIMVMVMLSVISIKMAFLYAAELLLFLVVTIPAIATIAYIDKLNDSTDGNIIIQVRQSLPLLSNHLL